MLGSHGEGVKDPKAGKLDNSLFFERVALPYVCVCATCVYIGMCVCPEWCLAVSKDSSMTSFPGSVQFSHSVVSNSLWPHGLQHARLPWHHQLPEPTQTHVHWVSDAIQPSHPLSSFRLKIVPSIFPSIRVFSNESVLYIKWPKYWSFSFSISPFNDYSGLISFRMDWLDLLAVQGTLKSLLQNHSSKASILRHSAFFMVQLSTSIHDYWKNHSFD